MDSVLISQGMAWEVRRKTPRTAWLPLHPSVYAQVMEVPEDTVNEQDTWDGEKFIPKPIRVPLTSAQLVDKAMLRDPVIRGLVRVLAQRFNLTEQQIVDAVKARAD